MQQKDNNPSGLYSDIIVFKGVFVFLVHLKLQC